MERRYIEFELKKAKFVSSIGEFCYKDIINDFSNAKYINIITYNISENSNLLMETLTNNLPENVPVTIITNIPNRWEDYTNNHARENASQKIDIYISKLNPENLSEMTSVFFNFHNHEKIIMTDNIIYWGSANYSDQSKQNYECGTISTDKDFIKFVNEQIVPSLIAQSIPYYQDNAYYYGPTITGMINVLETIIENLTEVSSDLKNNYLCYNDQSELLRTIRTINYYMDNEDVKENVKNEISLLKNEIEYYCKKLKEQEIFDYDTVVNEIMYHNDSICADSDLAPMFREFVSDDDVMEVFNNLIQEDHYNLSCLIESIQKYKEQLVDFKTDIFTVNKNINNTACDK